MNYRWSLAPAQSALADVLARGTQVSPLLAQCLLNRGYDEPGKIGAFLEPRLKSLRDPFLLPNMTSAVDRLMIARTRGQRVVIFGDYDVDGVSSTALLLEVFQSLLRQVLISIDIADGKVALGDGESISNVFGNRNRF